jgi:alpha-amylase
MRRLVWFVVLIYLLASCGQATPTAMPEPATPTASPTPTPTAGPTPTPAGGTWWDGVTFYEVFVRSFYDSDGDGDGDLPGLIEKLDYLNDGDPATDGDLGVTALWLMPIFASPSYHGYDVTDYYTVNPAYGTNEDFGRLMDEAHKRGIRIIIDLVLNHTSIEHPWFLDSASGPDAERRDWYVWADKDPGYLGPWGQQVWHARNGSYYYGVFWEGMPDLNLENPEVTAELYEIARYWLEEMGVDGFRLDAVKHFVEEGEQQVHTEMTHAWLAKFYDFVKGVDPEAFLIGEAWDSTALSAMYVGNEVDAVFEFSLATAVLDGVNRGRATPIVSAMRTVQRSYPEGGFAPFLTNHDQPRTMTGLRGDWAKAKLAATVLFTLPGTPFAYYGEEIGMAGTKPDEKIRTPMQWTSGPNADFTSGIPWQAVNPDYEEKNVELQSSDPGSLLNHYRTLVALRNEHAALGNFDYMPLESANASVLPYLRGPGSEAILVVVNLGREATTEYVLSSADSGLAPGRYLATDLLVGLEAEPLVVGQDGIIEGYQPLPEMPPQSALILQLILEE